MGLDLKGGHPDMDYDAHGKTYAGFIRASIVCTVVIALILVGMLFTLVP